jgi:hypothetical protein
MEIEVNQFLIITLSKLRPVFSNMSLPPGLNLALGVNFVPKG